MKAKDLIKILEKNPDYDINISVDVSYNYDESTYSDRAFSSDYEDFQVVDSSKRIDLLFDGYVNFDRVLTEGSQLTVL